MRAINRGLAMRLLASRTELRVVAAVASASALYGTSIALAEPGVGSWQKHVGKLSNGIGDGSAEAAAALADLTADAPETGDAAKINHVRNAVATAGAIPPLISLCKTGTPEGRTAAVVALRNLSKEEGNRNAIVAAGGIGAVVELVKAEGLEQATRAGLQTLSQLAECDAHKASISKAGAISPLVHLVKHGTPWSRARAAGVLNKLATTADNKVAIAAEGGIPALIMLALAGTQDGRATAAGCLWRLARNDNNRAAIAKFGGVPALLAYVATARSSRQQHCFLSSSRERGWALALRLRL